MNGFQFNIPNILTLSRVALIPVFVILVYFQLNIWATVVFIFSALTDFLDGYLARRNNQVSDFGKLMDPIADKILVMAALVMLVAQRNLLNAEPWVPAWMVVMILAREIWINGVRSFAASQGIVVAAGKLGKIKSFAQMVAIPLLLLHDLVLVEATYRFTAQFFGERLLLLSIVFSYWSAVEYTMSVFSPKTQKNSHF